MMRAPDFVFRSWGELQLRISSIVERLNEDRDLAVAAAANPFLALEELGYHVVPEARPEIEDRLRFPAAEVARRRKLRQRIFRAAGNEFDIRSPDALHRVLFHDLELKPVPDERGCARPLPSTSPLPRQRGKGEPPEDPLAALEGRHPIIEPLLEYRQLDARRWPLASPAAYRAIRKAETARGIRNMRIRLKEGAAGGGVRDSTPPRAATESPAALSVNAASMEELKRLPGIGGTLAERIVAYREEHGPFEELSELCNVSGITERLLAKLGARLTI